MKTGTKVKIPTQKTGGWNGIEKSQVVKMAIKNGQDHLFVVGRSAMDVYALNTSPEYTSGDWFHINDLEVYRKFKEGDKVMIPTKKSIGEPLDESNVVRRAKEDGRDFLTVKYYDESRGQEYVVVTERVSHGGDFFLESDLEHYVEPKRFKVGDKVKIPTQKTGKYPGIEYSIPVKRAKAQGFMYVTGFVDGDHYILRDTFAEGHGDFFKFEDVTEAYEEPEIEIHGPLGGFTFERTDGINVPPGVAFRPVSPYTVESEGVSLDKLVADAKKQTEELEEILDMANKLKESYLDQQKEIKELNERLDRLTEPVQPGVDYVQIKGVETSRSLTTYKFRVTFYDGDDMDIEMAFTENKLKAIWKNNQNVCGYVRDLFK